MISTIQSLGFLMEDQEGHKGKRGAHSLICSLGEFEREHEDEVGSIGRGHLGRFYSWRRYGSLDPYLFVVINIAWRRAHT